MTPIGNGEGEITAGSADILGMYPELSIATGLCQDIRAESCSASDSVSISGGQNSSGARVSETTTKNGKDDHSGCHKPACTNHTANITVYSPVC